MSYAFAESSTLTVVELKKGVAVLQAKKDQEPTSTSWNK